MDNIKQLKKFWSKKKVFITGHTGFKGSWLCIILSYLNADIHGYALKAKKNSLFKKSKVEKSLISNTFGNINDFVKLKKKVKLLKPEIIIHMAAQSLVIESYKNPLETFNTNIIGTLNLLESVKNVKSVKSVVIVTTDKVYKINKKNKSYKELDQLWGFDPYSASKVGAEIITDSYIQSFFKNSILKNKISTVRAGNVIGGGDYSKDRLVPDIIFAINNKKKLKIRNPQYIRPWQHVLDPLLGYLMLAKKQYLNKINDNQHAWNFGPSNKNFKKVIDVVKYTKKLQNFNYVISANEIFKETKSLKLNSSKAKKKLNWTSKLSLYESLKFTIDWNRQIKKKLSIKSICEQQFLMYINKK